MAQDLLGRQLEQTNMSLNDIKGLIRTLCLKDTKPVEVKGPNGDVFPKIKENTERSADALEDIKKTLDEWKKDWDDDRKKQENSVKEVKKYLEGMSSKKNEPQKSSGLPSLLDPSKLTNALSKITIPGIGQAKTAIDALKSAAKAEKNAQKGGTSKMASINEAMLNELKQMNSNIANIAGNISELTRHALKKGSIYTNDIHTQDSIDDLSKSIGAGTIGGKKKRGLDTAARGIDTGMPIKPKIEAADVKEVEEQAKNMSMRLGLMISSALTTAIGGGGLFKSITAGTQEDLTFVYSELNEIAFITKGITGETKGLQKEYMNYGSVVDRTGHGLITFQKSYINALKSGMKDQDRAMNITKTSLNLSTMIGSEASQTADTFNNWAMTMKLSENQMSQLSREVQMVAKTSGIVGDNLMQAVKASEQMVRNMDKAGTLTSEAAGNLIGLQAMGQKLGVEDSIGKINSALSNTAHLFFEADEKTQNFVFNAASNIGKLDELREGTLLQSREGIAKFAEGMEMTFQRFANVSSDAIDQIDPERLAAINMQMSQATGMQVNEMKKLIDAYREQSMSFESRTSKISDELANQNLTTEERIDLEKKLLDLQLNQGFKFATMFDEASKKGLDFAGTMESAFGDASKLSQDMKNDLRGMGIDLTNAADTTRGVLLYTADKLKEAGGTDFTSKIESALQSGDTKQVREVLAQMNEDQQKLGVEQIKSIDPIHQVAHTLNQLNETVRSFTTTALVNLIGIMGTQGLIAFYLSGMLTSLTLMAGSSKIGGMFGGLGSIFGGKKKEGGTGGAKGGAGGAAGGLMGAAAPDLGWLANPKELMKFGPKMAVAAGALAVAAIGLVALATAVIAISKGIMNIAGIEPTEAIKTGFAISAIIMAAGAIAIAALGAIKGLQYLGEFQKTFNKAALQTIGQGALALLIAAPVLTTLAIAVIGLSGAIMSVTGVDAGVAAKTAMSLAAILTATGLIAGAVLGSAIGLMALGAFVANPLNAAISAGLITLGAIALMALAPAMVELANSIITITESSRKAAGVDLKKAADAALSFAGIMAAAAAISIAVVGAAAALTLLSPLAILAIPASILMGLSAYALTVLTPAMVELAGAIIVLSQEAMKTSGANPDEAITAAWHTAKLISAAVVIGTVVGAAAAGLTLMAANIPLLLAAAPLMWLSSQALKILTPSMVDLSISIVSLSQEALASMDIGIEEATATASAVAALMESAAWIVTYSGLAAGALIGAATFLPALIVAAPFMWLSAQAFKILTPAMVGLAASIVQLSAEVMKSIGGNPCDWIYTAQAVGQLMEAASSIITNVGIAALSLTAIGTTFPTIIAAIPLMAAGAGVLYMLTSPIINLAASIISMSQGIISASGATPDVAIQTAEAVETVLNASYNILNSIVGLGTTLTLMGSMLPFAWTIIPLMTSGMLFFLAASIPITQFIMAIMQLGMSVAQGVPPAHMKMIVEGMCRVSTAIDSIIGVMDVLSEKITPMTSRPWFGFGNSPIESLADATVIFGKQFPIIASFIKDGLIKPSASLANVGDLKTSMDVLKQISQMISLIPPIITTLSDSFVPLTEGNLYGLFDSRMDKVAGLAEGGFSKNFENISKFVQDGIVNPIRKYFGDTETIDSASKQVMSMAQIISNISPMLQMLSDSIVPMVGGGLWKKGLADKMNEEFRNKFMEFFYATSAFLRYGIIRPVLYYFPDEGEVETASDMIKGMAGIVSSLPGIMDTMVNGLVPLFKQGWWDEAPADKIDGEFRDKFTNFFNATAEFLRRGIIEPVLRYFPDSGEVESASKSIEGMASILGALPKMMDLMIKGLVPLFKKDWFKDAPADKIGGDFRNNFTKFFNATAEFLRCGIIEPILYYFPDSGEVESASTSVSGMASILDNLSGIMDTLVFGVIGLLNPGWFGEAPADKITNSKDKFMQFFNATSEFLRCGIIEPILYYFPDKSEVETASKALAGMNEIVSMIPTFIEELGSAMGDIMNRGYYGLTKSPAEEMLEKVDIFASWFGTVSSLLYKGIVYPIFNYFPNTEEIKEAQGRLQNIVGLVGSIPGFMSDLGESVGKLTGGWWWTGLGIAAALGAYAPFWYGVGSFLRNGIVDPINNQLPDIDEIEAAAEKMKTLASVLGDLVKVMESLGDLMSKLEGGEFNNLAGLSDKINPIIAEVSEIDLGAFSKTLPKEADMLALQNLMSVLTLGFDMSQASKGGVMNAAPATAGAAATEAASAANGATALIQAQSAIVNIENATLQGGGGSRVNIPGAMRHTGVHGTPAPGMPNINEMNADNAINTVANVIGGSKSAVNMSSNAGIQQEISNTASKNLQNIQKQQQAALPAVKKSIVASFDEAMRGPSGPANALNKTMGDRNSPFKKSIREFSNKTGETLSSVWNEMDMEKSVISAKSEGEKVRKFAEQAQENSTSTYRKISENALRETESAKKFTKDLSKRAVEENKSIFSSFYESIFGVGKESKVTSDLEKSASEAAQEAVNALPVIGNIANQDTSKLIQEGAVASGDMSFNEKAMRDKAASYRYAPEMNVNREEYEKLTSLGFTDDQILGAKGHARGGEKALVKDTLAEAQRKLERERQLMQREALLNSTNSTNNVSQKSLITGRKNWAEERPERNWDKERPERNWDKERPERNWDKTRPEKNWGSTRNIKAPGYAKGGSFLADGPQLIVVGEKGPELVNVIPTQMAQGKNHIVSQRPTGEVVPPTTVAETDRLNASSITDVHQEMRQKYASEQEGAGTARNKDAAKLVYLNEEQLSYLMLIHEDMKEVIGLLTPSGNLSGNTDGMKTGETRTNRLQPKTAADYGTWQFGKANQGASKAVVNVGGST